MIFHSSGFVPEKTWQHVNANIMKMLTCSPASLAHLARRDKKMAAVIERLGPIEREGYGNLFHALVHSIAGQQISGKALASIWQRVRGLVGDITPERMAAQPPEALQACGLSSRKVEYILDLTRQVLDGELDLAAIATLPDSEVIARLVALRGIGAWTAEMMLLFCLRRPDIISFGDLGIHRGLRMLYRHRTIDRTRFARYCKRFSPYGSTASLYLWAIAGGALPELTDPAA